MGKVERDWLDLRLEHLDGRPLAQARLLLCSNDLPGAWRKLAELGEEVERRYWEEFSPYNHGADFTLINKVAEQLLAHNRPLMALVALQLYLRPAGGAEPPSPDLVAQGLETLVRLPKHHHEPAGLLNNYTVDRLLDYLAASNLDEDRLASLEWQLFPARGFNQPSLVLERRLARSPEFFVDILSLCFRRRDGVMEQEIPQDVASNAFHLLREWKTVPGSDSHDGEVNQPVLMEWVSQARALAADRDRGDIADIHIGQVFAQARQDPDETWPTLPVRNVIEQLANEKIEKGFCTGALNKRGFTSRGLTDGGKQEYVLADQFDKWAGPVADRWPRTASMLRTLAESYRTQGRQEDEEAERFRRGVEE